VIKRFCPLSLCGGEREARPAAIQAGAQPTRASRCVRFQAALRVNHQFALPMLAAGALHAPAVIDEEAAQ
jgi:hypothetical protein